MKKQFYAAAMLMAILTFNSCKKDAGDTFFNDAFSGSYTTGIIKFQYQTHTTVNGITVTKDTIVSFTSIGNNPSEKDDFGYSQPANSWVQLYRVNPEDFQNKAFIFFAGTDLNSLTLPYKFKADDIQNAQINYVIDSENMYAASTLSGNFELTVLTRINNRLQGTYSGIIKNQDGHTLNIKKGLFDIAIVEK